MAQPRYVERGSSSFGSFTYGVKWLVIINTAVFLVWSLGSADFQSGVLAWLGLSPTDTLKHVNVWELFSYLFLHGGVWHLVFNMLSLWMFGSPLEGSWGTRRFLKYYF